jgi:hypothetical protein
MALALGGAKSLVLHFKDERKLNSKVTDPAKATCSKLGGAISCIPLAPYHIILKPDSSQYSFKCLDLFSGKTFLFKLSLISEGASEKVS